MHKSEWYQHPTNLIDLFEDAVARHANRNWIGAKTPAGNYQWITYRDAASRIDDLRAGLSRLGVGRGDTVGLIINNAIEWALIAFATYGLGARLVPMYESELEKTWRYIVQDSGIKVLFIKDQGIYDQVKSYPDAIETLQKLVFIRGEGELTMAALESLGKESPVASIKPDWNEVASLIYTSGTSGNPKGVLLIHGNFTSNVLAVIEHFPVLTHEEITFSILPWAHSFGQTGELYLFTHLGASMGIMGSVNTISDDIRLVKPTVLIAVPRIFNRIYTGIQSRVEQAWFFKRIAFKLAKKAARSVRETGRRSILLPILDWFAFRQIRERFGGRLKYACTGSAAMNPEILRFFFDIGISIYEGYGMTETTPVITSNQPNAIKVGSVGRPIKNVTVVIDKSQVGEDSPDGEIICFGPNVMLGYHNQPEKTKEVFVDDPELGRGVRTGDRGRLDSEGFLYITGRFKEEYKLENGKYVHPGVIEEEIKLLPSVVNAMIYGDGKKYNTCLVVPDFDVLAQYAQEMGITSIDPNVLVEDGKIKSRIGEEITNHLKGAYGEYEIPQKYHLITEDFTIENGMLTQTMKLKRREVLKKYGDVLNGLYE
jgi:long-chain acyl-CoA synthetase